MGSFSFDDVNSLYMDVFREIGNIGAGNATTAVASMLQLRVDMKVPKVELMNITDFGTAICPEEEVIAGILLELESDISGSMMFLMRLDSAHYLVNTLMGGYGGNGEGETFNEMEQSALKEIGNIIAGSYLSAISSMTNLTITPSVPFLAVDMAASILSVPAIQFGQYGDKALLIETEFTDDLTISGYFILLPDEDSYDKILAGLGIPLN
ncbi:MAG: chemotaxis protein CheC [Lachnospiraceae bacterium]|nr:chemotaxis protein CheC [Lachnospiraceae bacterium]